MIGSLVFVALAASEPEGIAEETAESSEVTTQVVDEMMKRLAREANQEGLRHIDREDYPAAFAAFQQAHELDNEDAEITNNLGYVYHRLGNLERGAYFYRLTLTLDPERVVAYVNLVDLLLDVGDETACAEADQVAGRLRELRGNDPGVLLRQARAAACRDDFATAERRYVALAERKDTKDALRLEIGDFYNRFERAEAAKAWYEQISDPDLRAAAADHLQAMRVEREARRFGFTRSGATISARARERYERARRAAGQGRAPEAVRILTEILEREPTYSAARVLLGELQLERGSDSKAEVTWLRGIALDHSSPELHARLGTYYMERNAGDDAATAAILLERAAQLRPDREELLLWLAKARRRTGDLPGARRALEQFLAKAHDAAARTEARALKATLDELLTADPDHRSRPAGDTEAAQHLARLSRVRALLSQGQTDAAMAEIRASRHEDLSAELRVLEGVILLAAGQREEAARSLEEAVTIDADRADAHRHLGIIRAGEQQLEAALIHLERAESLGDAEAGYHRVRVEIARAPTGVVADAFGLRQLRAWHARLVHFVGGHGHSPYADAAHRHLEQLDNRIYTVYAIALPLLLMLLFGAAQLRRRIWGGADLVALIRDHPESGPEVQRVLSAIRHEVLKHNTMMLTGLVEALETGADLGDQPAHLQRTLLGGAGVDGVVSRLRNYVAELRKIGRVRGVRLNLRYKDAAIGAILKGFRILRRLGPRLSAVGQMPVSRRKRLAADLRRAAVLLNTDGYEAVRSLLDQLRVLRVDEELLTAIFKRTRNEPALSALPVALELDTDGALPCGIAVSRADFEDILGNLLRNAIQSSAIGSAALGSQRTGDIIIGLGVGEEVNAITGHERVVFQVRDRSERQLTEEQLRSGNIEGGLGLTADLVTRYEGSLDVETGLEGWQKAVVVKLPRHEHKAGRA